MPLFCKVYIACQTLHLSTETRFSAMVLLHRYLSHYRFHQSHHEGVSSSSTNDRDNERRQHLGNVAAACMFLACKSNNQSRRIRDVMNACHILQFQHQEPKADADSDAITLLVKKHPKPLNDEYWFGKETIVKVEQHVLRMLRFDVTVSQPHRMLVVVYEEVEILLGEQHTKEYLESALKIAWKRLNDAMFYTPALRLDCLSLACAALCLALDECCSKEGKMDNGSQKSLNSKWWNVVNGKEAKILDAKEKLKEATAHLSNVR